jgi:hypothetical protein
LVFKGGSAIVFQRGWFRTQNVLYLPNFGKTFSGKGDSGSWNHSNDRNGKTKGKTLYAPIPTGPMLIWTEIE